MAADKVFRVKVQGTINFVGIAYIKATSEDDADVKVQRLKSELFAGKEIIAQRDLNGFELDQVATIKKVYDPEKCAWTEEVGELVEKFPNYVLTDEAQKT